MRMVFVIADRTRKHHPSKDKSAGRGWYEGFKVAILILHCVVHNHSLTAMFYAQTKCELFVHSWLLLNPMLVYNADESGINVVYKPGKIPAMVGRKNVYSIAAGE